MNEGREKRRLDTPNLLANSCDGGKIVETTSNTPNNGDMKQPIAILATAIAASGFTAFGQDWITFSLPDTTIWLNHITPAMPAADAGTVNAIILWSANTTVGSGDLLPSVGSEFGLRGTGTVLDQVATNALDFGGAEPIFDIQEMLSSGWSIAVDMATGMDAVGNDSASGRGGLAYNSGDPFQVQGVTGASGSEIQEIVLGYPSTTSSYTTAVGLGWSNPFDITVGTSSTDPNASATQTSANQFAVVIAPEPTTLALAGLGGLSLLAFRRKINLI